LRGILRQWCGKQKMTPLNIYLFRCDGVVWSAGYALFFNKTLTHLNLANNNVGSRGAFVIAVALKRNTAMR
jgi:hypothetical protein